MLLLPRLNDYQRNGVASLTSLNQPVQVIRDESGMAYIRAESLLDAIRAQGYVTAQDRLFQLQLTRIAVSGRLAELFGEDLLDRDKRQRTLGFYRAAEAHAHLLDDNTVEILQAYADGINAFIENPDESVPLELRLAGIPPRLWQIEDSLAIIYFMGWGSAADLDGELLAQAIIEKIGVDRYREIAPLSINPDEEQGVSVPSTLLNASENSVAQTQKKSAEQTVDMNSIAMRTLVQFGCCHAGKIALGSNNWAVSGERSPGGKPVVSNDPHLETSLLPTTFYPVGLFTPDLRAVGVNVAGLPGMIIGRNQTVAAGVTNAYADAQDVFIETIDPDQSEHYLEGEKSIPFEVIKEEIRVRDKTLQAGYRIEHLDIRLTRRGPIISDLDDTAAPDNTDRALSVRWAPYETMGPRLGLDYLLRAKSVADIRRSLEDVTAVHLNFVFADSQGDLGWQVSGRIPYRRNSEGGRPVEVVDETDHWTGWVPFQQMPSSYEHPQGWVGTANHKTVPDAAPYYYSGYLAPDYRIRRMKELFDGDAQIDVEQHWNAMRDDLNLLARDVIPVFVKALAAKPETAELAEILAAWDFHDSADAAAPLVFHEIWRRMLEQTLSDELGQELAGKVTATAYFWSQRMQRWVLDGESDWFDTTGTDATETLDDVIQAAALEARQSIVSRLGHDMNSWRWGDLHQMEILNPLRRSGIGKGLLGGGSHAASGSAHTLYRGSFDLSKPDNKVVVSAALRMVADLADDEKVIAVLPGGVSGRAFTRNFVDQVDDYMSGEQNYWWFDDGLIDQHAQSVLTLLP